LAADHPNVKFFKTCRFAKCSICHKLKAEIEAAGNNESLPRVQAANRALMEHREEICAERRFLYNIWDSACHPDATHVAVMLDGAFNADGNFPHLRQNTKMIDSHPKRLEINLTGGFVHLPQVQVLIINTFT
jgi:hypothetical protein